MEPAYRGGRRVNMKFNLEITLLALAVGLVAGMFLAVVVRGLFRSLGKWADLESRADFVLRRADEMDVAYQKVMPLGYRLEAALSEAGKFEKLHSTIREQADRIDALSRELNSAKSEIHQLRTRL